MPKAHLLKTWASSATYDGTHGAAKHKWYCKAKPSPDVAKCPKTMKGDEALKLVRMGLKLGLVKIDPSHPTQFPRRVYAFSINEKEKRTWFEAKRTFPNKGEYHGYPISVKSVPQAIIDRIK